MFRFDKQRLLRAETLSAATVLVAAIGLLFPATQLRPLSALLPVAMLLLLILLSIVLLVIDQRKAAAGEAANPVTEKPKRVFGALCLVALYVVLVELIGFYISTALAVPTVAYVFGYRNRIGLATASVIVLMAIYLIFDFALSQDFPVGLLWSM